MPALYLFSRSTADSASSSHKTLYIAGFILAAVTISAVAAWIGLQRYRKHVASKREEKLGAAFLSVRGLVKDPDSAPWIEKETIVGVSEPNSIDIYGRNGSQAKIFLPSTAMTRPPKIPHQANQPISIASTISTLTPDSPTQPSFFRSSYMEAANLNSRFSVVSNQSSEATPSSGTVRKIRQVFTPVLPDELLISHLGEQLTVIQSFEDGWCAVGREKDSIVHTAKSLFKTTPNSSNVELGVVPAWCFLKPVKGLRAERPMRSTSLGISIAVTEVPKARQDVLSWSNF